jgi:hypothetical protein
MLSRDVCRIHFCVQVHARRGEQERKMWLVLSLLLLDQHLCYVFPRGNSDWRFVCSLSRRAAAAGNMGFRGVDSIVHISVVPASEKGKERRAEMCVTLGRSSFGEEFLTFNLLHTVVPRSSSDEYWTGLDWKSGNLRCPISTRWLVCASR